MAGGGGGRVPVCSRKKFSAASGKRAGDVERRGRGSLRPRTGERHPRSSSRRTPPLTGALIRGAVGLMRWPAALRSGIMAKKLHGGRGGDATRPIDPTCSKKAGDFWLAAAGACIILVQIGLDQLRRLHAVRPQTYRTGLGDRGDRAAFCFRSPSQASPTPLREDAYPRVTMLTDRLPATGRKIVALVNMTLMLGVGLFLSRRRRATPRSGPSTPASSSEILLWPRWIFWAPGAASLILFAIYAALRLARIAHHPRRGDVSDGMV